MAECIFCKIIKGEIPSHKIYEDKDSFAFLDINPHAKGHTVVIPKVHAETIFDLEGGKSEKLMKAVKITAEKIRQVLNPDGFNIGWNDGSAAGQVVPHLHIHILPRYSGDGGGNMHSIVKNPQVSVEKVAKLFK